VAEGSDDRLAPGMLISIEPGIYLPGVGGVRHSDTVLVTKEGPESLTRYPTDLDSLILGGARLWPKIMGALTRRVAGIKEAT
jgi:Xaa-Pro dipeptidase